MHNAYENEGVYIHQDSFQVWMFENSTLQEPEVNETFKHIKH